MTAPPDVVDAVVTPDDIERAWAVIAGHVRVTPIVRIAAGELGVPLPAVLKLELLQHTGSFKPRGAFHRVLTADIPPAGLIAASGGNHGAAVAHVARCLGLRAEVFVPATSPTLKRQRIEALGAELRVIEGLYDHAQRAADERARETGGLLVHPYNSPVVIAGQGTMSMELERQAGTIDTLLASTGGGGFVAGQAAWFADRARVVSVEPTTSQCLRAALAAGEPTDVEVRGLAADSLGAARIGDAPWAVVRRYVHDAVVVDDDAIRDAQRAIWDGLRLIAEPGGAAALAALRTGAYLPADGERVAVAICGSNADPSTIV
ncbi:MAG: threonine/serine dehydratase [Ilumatobacteraceae bacterium]